MCGIAGRVTCDGEPVDVGVLGRMCAALTHRGPDSRGIHTSPGVGLGIQRLRVIDIETGDQPIYNEDRSVAVVLNGEIYNFRELRKRLQRTGHRFTTQGDTEVIAHLYEEEGPECVRSLHGMFAFALWDVARRQLLLARDRVGKKPLFYAHDGGTLTFASELGALMQAGDIPRDIDHQALGSYLAHLYVPAPQAAFRAARKLPPATTLLYRHGHVTTRRYWRLDYSRTRPVHDPTELHEEIRAALRRAVRRRLVADVPLGAFLSGGIDSSAVVAAMAEASSEPVKTFSIGFEHETFNELPFAREVARRFATDHHEFVVRPDAIEMLPAIIRRYGEPFADSSAIPSFYLAGLTREHVTVALNGDGGDESFGGYQRYVSNLLASRLDRLPLALRRSGAAMTTILPRSGSVRSPLNKARRLAGSLALDPAARYFRYMCCFDGSDCNRLLTDDYSSLVGRSRAEETMAGHWHEASGESPLDVMLEVDVNTYLPGDLLVKMDIAAMAHSLETRSPFLDHELMELAASIPAGMKVRGTQKKVVLRDALRGWLPEGILDRPKQGFSVPLADWFRGSLHEFAREILLDRVTRDRGYFRETAVADMIERHAAGREDHSPRIWALLVLELWHRELVDGVDGRRADAAQPASELRLA